MSRESRNPKPLKVGELARKTGKTVRALRLYEELGLLQPMRSDGGFRLYGPDQVARVYWIAKLQDMGFSLAQIQNLLATVEESKTAPEAMQSVREMFRNRLATTRDQVEKLLQLERDLVRESGLSRGVPHVHATTTVPLMACVTCDSVHAQTPRLQAWLRACT